MDFIQNTTVVIRSVKERTEQLCKALILEQGLPEKNLFIIHEKPFSKAMKVGYQIGIDQNLEWTYCLDADVLLRKNSLSEIISIAESKPSNVFGLSGKLLDKLFGVRRSVGNHLFRTSYLPLVLKEIKEYENETVRPESYVKNQLEKRGLKWHKSDIYIGIHDFEQHYHDIARKAFVHSHKHTERLSELITFWMLKAEVDKDYEAALFGVGRGLSNVRSVKINVGEFEKLYDEAVKKFGVKNDINQDSSLSSHENVLMVMNKNENHFQASELMVLYHSRHFKKMFYNEKSYLSIFYHLKEKIIRDLSSNK